MKEDGESAALPGAAVEGLRSFIDSGTDVPSPGTGDSWRRFEILTRWAARDLSVGRLVEGHTDARAILEEAGAEVPPAATTYGVWAARQRGHGVIALPVSGGWTLSGVKPFCSGSTQLDRALITAEAPDGYRLFDVSVSANVVGRDVDSWPAVGMAASLSETLTFGGPTLPTTAAVGGPGFYTERPGFWFGAAGVAACWYGGAVALVDNLTGSARGGDEHVLAELGLAFSSLVSMRETLRWAAAEMDADPGDEMAGARQRALTTRQVVHDGCSTVLSAISAAGGARPLTQDAAQARRAADLFVYLAQHHGNADAAELGRIILGRLG